MVCRQQLEACGYEELAIKPLFTKGPSLGVRLLVFTVLAVALMVVDARFAVLKPLRTQLGLIVEPVYWLGRLPVTLWESATQGLSSRSELTAENERLKAEQLMMQRRLQKLAALTEQNVRLRELLNSSALVDDEVLATELIGIDPNPFTHRILIDKGAQDGVLLGQPVLDARGLMGQVVEVLRAIASGTGNPERLELRHVADTADIKEGDLLVSSGLGQRFPAGYPVATVTEVIHDSGQPFAIVRAMPTASLNRSRYMLLVFTDPRSPEQRATESAQAQEALDREILQQAGTPPAAAPASEPAPDVEAEQ